MLTIRNKTPAMTGLRQNRKNLEDPMAKKATKKAASKKAAPKKATKKAAPKKAAKATKKAAPKKAASKRKPNPAFMRPLTPSPVLAAVIGASAIPRTQVVKKLWDYIKRNKLQDSQNRRNINADDKLKALFGKSTVSMFEMTKIVSKHLK
jgi:chromatin remodeling complex protein RSC6